MLVYPIKHRRHLPHHTRVAVVCVDLDHSGFRSEGRGREGGRGEEEERMRGGEEERRRGEEKRERKE